MSDILRRIIAAERLEDNPFFKDAEGRIIELTSDRGEVFTGYYQADDATYYAEKDWLEKERALELERLAELEYKAEQAKLSAAREAREQKRAALEQLSKKAEKGNKNTVQPTQKMGRIILIFASASILIAIIALSYFMWPRTTSAVTTPTSTIENDSVKEPTPTVFGNAIITGSDVRMRMEPNLEAKVITFFPEEGEAVQLLQPATDSLNWAKVQRENGTAGWVYANYVKPLQ